jgi:hypothetical protein
VSSIGFASSGNDEGRLAAAFDPSSEDDVATQRWCALCVTSLVQRWRALNRGFDLQITKTLPRRRTTLQSR